MNRQPHLKFMMPFTLVTDTTLPKHTIAIIVG